eukprot:gene34587-biopygen33923
MLAGDTPPGEEVTPEVQVANYCKMAAIEQLGTGPVHRGLFDLHHQDELECNHAALFDTDQPELVVDSGRLARAAWKALSLVRPTRGTHGEGSPAVYSNEYFEGERILKPEKVDTRVLDKRFFSQAREEGVVCYEPCGGLCAGLEMLLRNGIKWSLGPSLPHDLHDTASADFIRAGSLQGQQWVMVRGFPCQDLSPAGTLTGLDGRHSKLFYEVVRLLSTLQQLQKQRPPGYVLENVSPLSHRPGTKIRDELFPCIASVICRPVSFDAAQAARMGTVVRSADEDTEEESREVNLDEKSRAMGYSAGELRMADGLNDGELASILGLAMDRRAMELLMAVAEASRKGLP